MNIEPLDTLEGSGFPACQQLSVFLENRVGQLLRLTRVLDAEQIRILALSVEGSVDCAIVRMIVNDPDTATSLMSDSGFAVASTEVLVVELPAGKRGILSVCAALISGEVNINYTYPILSQADRGPCLAIQVDNLSLAAKVLSHKKFLVLDQHEL
ncbi:MAG: hypothetical protein JNG88_09600 [Phycisphaerales bacterium]|nr:hypothetical protein [Phycisphaerales bacterium]